jgi:hypothetical protein
MNEKNCLMENTHEYPIDLYALNLFRLNLTLGL